MAFKTVDKKGRVTLGRKFAGRGVQIERAGDDLVLRFAKVVPDREAWLWENEAAAEMVGTGLAQARRGELGEGPDLKAAFDLADGIPTPIEPRGG